ncbi:hypothetical protein [Alkalihalobacillus sp. BA299]|uniref:hypothetical protein n=1 Tax=Alkalihalobacillus sp. BA299 TaxID=2815938 RepID=UPI001ADABAAA|nr:hypothetical protein [Alkalihalobacillus sp. BA299]
MASGTYVAATVEVELNKFVAEKSKKTTWIPEKYQTNVILLFQLFIGGAIAIVLDKLTGIPYSIWALTIGIIGKVIGFYPDRVMERANAFTIGMIGLVFLVISFMNEITFEMIMSSLPEVLTIIILGVIGIILGGYIGSKLFKWHPYKGIPVALTATFGFPADYIVCEEVSRSVGRN